MGTRNRRRSPGKDRRRVVIVGGVRTPFARLRTAFSHLSALDLGKIVCSELIQRVDLDPAEIDQVVYGQVIPSLSAPNIAREIVLGTGLPRTVEAYSVSRACTTGYQAVVSVAQAIRDGQIDCGIAGGAESASDVPITVPPDLRDALFQAGQARSVGERVKAFANVGIQRLLHLLPEPPDLTEPSTGETMGQSAERMAKDFGIPRDEQDALAHRSHVRAAAAWEKGLFDEDVMPVHIPPDYRETLERDNLVRADSDLEKLAKLNPVFDRRDGTLTAGNSSPLTDGASAVMLMTAEKAKALGLPVLGAIRSHAFTALDPAGHLLLGPATAAPRALDRAGLSLKEMDLVDMHEAFAAQVLCVLRAFESKAFAEKELGRSRPTGTVDWDTFNVNGGSIALGHPFAATGGRQIFQTLRELSRRDGAFALCTACAAGGMGAAMVLERA